MEVLLGASIALDGFGSGSSREDAVRALKGAGVEAVIAKSFAFICKFEEPLSYNLVLGGLTLDRRRKESVERGTIQYCRPRREILRPCFRREIVNH
jgi:3-isopropylmalate dehydratase small subunit